jgi:tetrahydromethanopterin S-methyltransferase subunit C
MECTTVRVENNGITCSCGHKSLGRWRVSEEEIKGLYLQHMNTMKRQDARVRRVVRYGKTSGMPDMETMSRAADAVGTVQCAAHSQHAMLDTFAGGVAAIRACCPETLFKAEKALMKEVG